MKYNFRHIALFAFTALCFMGCAGESYPGLEYDRTVSEDIINNESGLTTPDGVPIEVFVSPQRFVTTTTRGLGPFIVPDSMDAISSEDSIRYSNRYVKSLFYTFAFRDTPDDQGALTYQPDFTKHSNDKNDGKVNCLVDAGDKPHGMPGLLDADHSGRIHMKRAGLRLDTTMYYGNRYKDVGYNFFVYSVDDLPLEGKMHRDETGVWYDVDLDGTRDIMAGAAPLLTPEVLDTAYAEISRNLTREERDHILNVGNYSDFAAQRGIHPYVPLKHQLARLRFQGFPADRSCDSVFIESIEIEGMHSGKLYVATPNSDNIGLHMDSTRAWIPLHEIHPTKHRDSLGLVPLMLPLDTLRNHVSWIDGMSDVDWTKNKPTVIGGDMMIPEDTLLMMHLVYRQILRNKDPETGLNKINRVEANYKLPAPQTPISFDEEKRKYKYRRGFVYNINIGVYGLRPLEVIVTTGNWIDGGTIIIEDS
jgi:hypothetical protein